MTSFTGTFDGNLTADPSLRVTPSGVPVVNFDIAHTPRTFDKSTNEWKNAGDTIFVRVTAWRKLAENIAESLHKGNNVIVNGNVTLETYTTKEGAERSAIKITADQVAVPLARQTVSSVERSNSEGGSNNGGGGSRPAPAASQAGGDPWASGSSNGGFSDEPPF